jgi:hypothetical protein
MGEDVAFAGFIKIEGGFVFAQRGGTGAADIGRGNIATGAGTVTISGGSVYAVNAATVPAPKNAAGTPVYPLYVPTTLGGNKTISVPSYSPVYTAITINTSAACFLTTGRWTEAGPGQFPDTAVSGLDGSFLHIFSAALWLPVGVYNSITVTGDPDTYTADVTATFVPYTNRLIQ